MGNMIISPLPKKITWMYIYSTKNEDLILVFTRTVFFHFILKLYEEPFHVNYPKYRPVFPFFASL